MLTIGCHLSASDGFLAMGRTALDIGANTFQFFTRNPRAARQRPSIPPTRRRCWNCWRQTVSARWWLTRPTPSTPALRRSGHGNLPG